MRACVSFSWLWVELELSGLIELTVGRQLFSRSPCWGEGGFSIGVAGIVIIEYVVISLLWWM